MAHLLKNIYSPAFYERFYEVLEEVLPAFDREKCAKLIFDQNWEKRELKDRMRHTSLVLKEFLPDDFEQAVEIILHLISNLRKRQMEHLSLEFMFFPHYIETYGIEEFNVSVRAMETVTQFSSCEYAVRPFILSYGEEMLEQMRLWSLHENQHVRRLASEGSRPRLPWAMALPHLKKDPKPILPILEHLKSDPSEYVRRSVANNLNDISKDHPNLVLSIARQWKGLGKETDALIKHGCRTLLKQGNPAVLEYYGLNDSEGLLVKEFKISTQEVEMGGILEFSFVLKNAENKPKTARVEYAIYYLRKNGRLSRKVFKISERALKAQEEIAFYKKHSFKVITTRRFYEGQQNLSVVINGQEKQMETFELLGKKEATYF